MAARQTGAFRNLVQLLGVVVVVGLVTVLVSTPDVAKAIRGLGGVFANALRIATTGK